MLKQLVICLAVWLGGLGLACAQEPTPFESAAPQAILMDAMSGLSFYEKDADRAVPPASMSKLMTMVLVFDALKKGEVRLDQEFLVSENAWRSGGAMSGGSTMYAELNSRVKLDDLIHGAIIQSANDACIAIAEGMAGSEAAFVTRMNDKAKELGLKNATFRNSTGLPDPQHLMSVRDLATLARYIVSNHPDRYTIYRTPEFTWNKITQQNRNPLLKDYPGADGMKTGFTKEAGYGLVGSAQRDGRRLIMVIAGLPSIAARKAEAQKLLDWGFSQFRAVDVYAADERITKVRVWGGVRNKVTVVSAQPFRLALSPREQETAELKLDYTGPLMAPVKKGQPVGTIKVVAAGHTLAEAPAVAGDDVAEDSSMWGRAWDSILIMIFGG